MRPKFAPSLMCMDLSKVGAQLSVLDKYMDLYHVDIMDGHFCKNISLSPDFANMVAVQTTLPLDVHLMVTQPSDIIPLLHLRPVDFISPHAETINSDAFRVMNMIREKGCHTGLVLNPATPLESVRHYLNRVDMLTIMTVDVGFVGQPFIEEMLAKICEARELREANHYHYQIQIDGSCNQKTYARLYQAGADIYIVGRSGLFKLDDNLEKAVEKMHLIFEQETGAVQ